MAQTGYDDEESRSFVPAAPTCQITYLSDGRDTPYRLAEKRGSLSSRRAAAFLRRAAVTRACCWPAYWYRQLATKGPARKTPSRAAAGTVSDILRSWRRAVDVVLDTYGGSLDSAFKTVLFLSASRKELGYSCRSVRRVPEP